jgi:hypothetical protein
MSTEQEKASAEAARVPQKPPEPSTEVSLTDLLDRLDREAFRRSLELRDARLSAHARPAQRR